MHCDVDGRDVDVETDLAGVINAEAAGGISPLNYLLALGCNRYDGFHKTAAGALYGISDATYAAALHATGPCSERRARRCPGGPPPRLTSPALVSLALARFLAPTHCGHVGVCFCLFYS